MLEAIDMCERLTGKPMNWSYSDENRKGDNIWWVSDIRKFCEHYPEWGMSYGIEKTLEEIYLSVEEFDA